MCLFPSPFKLTAMTERLKIWNDERNVHNGYSLSNEEFKNSSWNCFSFLSLFLFHLQQCNVATNEVCCTVRSPPPPPPPTRSNEYIPPPPPPTAPPATPCLDRNSVCVQSYQCSNGVVQRGSPLGSNRPVSWLACRRRRLIRSLTAARKSKQGTNHKFRFKMALNCVCVDRR